MSALFLPWNPNPESTSQITGSYTVPAGKFARAVCQVERGGTSVTINGTVVLRSPPNYSELDRNISIEGIATSSSNDIFTASRPAVVSIFIDNAPLLTVDIVINAIAIRFVTVNAIGGTATSGGSVYHDGTSTFIPNIQMGTGAILRIPQTNNRYAVSGQYTKVETMEEVATTNEYRLKEGDVINGGLKHIEVFPIINNS